jgi:hypothetical protein
MNTYEIDEAAERWCNHPVLGKATRFLAAYRDEVNAKSDGWAYWHTATRAAAKLVGMIEHANRERDRYPPEPGPDEAALKRAISPIKAFYTRHGNAAGMKFPLGIIDPLAIGEAVTLIGPELYRYGSTTGTVESHQNGLIWVRLDNGEKVGTPPRYVRKGK